MGLPEDFRKDLELMLRHHVTVRQILIGLDEFSFRLDPAIVDADYYKIPYQENNLRTYIAYLFRTPSKPYRWESGQIYDIENTGRVLLGNRDEAIERNPEEHRKKSSNRPRGHPSRKPHPRNARGHASDQKHL